MPSPGHTVAATPADHMPLPADNISGGKVMHVRSNAFDTTHEFMLYHHGHGNGFLCPGIPVPDVDIRSADACPQNPHQHIVDSDLGLWDIFEPKPFTSVFLD